MSPAANQAAAKSAQPKTNDWPGLALRLLVVAAAVCAGAWLSLTGLRTPAPRPAIATEFSAIRAADRAHALLGDQPRPVGSTANAAAVERLASWLRARKMEVEVQEATVRAGGRDVTLRNIIARRTGALPGKAVLFVAHHDTVAASPGAGDDGMGVAIALELADALNGSREKAAGYGSSESDDDKVACSVDDAVVPTLFTAVDHSGAMPAATSMAGVLP